MKLKFNPNLEYQDLAISSVVDLFKGQRSALDYMMPVKVLEID